MKEDILKNRYFKDLTPEQSEEIQEHAIELDYIWSDGTKKIRPKYNTLEFDHNKRIWKDLRGVGPRLRMAYKEFKSKIQFKDDKFIKVEEDWWKDLKVEDYLVIDSKEGSGFRENYIIKILELIDTYSPKRFRAIDCTGCINGWNVKFTRKATKEEIEMYEDAGKSVDVTTYKMKKSEYNVGNFVVFLEDNIQGNGFKRGNIQQIRNLRPGVDWIWYYASGKANSKKDSHLIKPFKTKKEAEEFSKKLLGKTNGSKFNKWYKHNNYPELLDFITADRYYGFDVNGNWFNAEHNIGDKTLSEYTLASNKEVEEKLLTFANNKYPIGTEYSDSKGNSSTVKGKFYYRFNGDKEWITDGYGGSIYFNGEWAKITKSSDNITPNLIGKEVIFTGKMNLTPKKDKFIPLYIKKVCKKETSKKNKIDINLISKKQFKKI